MNKTEPKPNGDPKDSTFQCIIEKSYTVDAKKEDKDQRVWFKAESKGRKFWTREPEVGEMLLEANGLEVVLKLRSGSRPNIYRVMDVQPVPSAETRAAVEQAADDLPWGEEKK